MQTKELFLKDPLTWKLVNEGVSSNNTEDLDTLRFELESVGLPEGYPYAKFLIHLKRDGTFDAFKKAIEDQGKNFEQELGRFYTSGAVAKAYVQCYDHLKDPSQVGALLRADYPNVDDVSM